MTESEIFVREASKEEWEEAMELAWRTFLKYEGNDYTKEGIDSFLEFISGDKIYEMFQIGEYKLWVAFIDKEMVGMGSLRNGNHISLLFVKDGFLRKGIGKAILREMQKKVELEYNKLILTVYASPYGVPFYARLGFKAVSEPQEEEGIIYTPMKLLSRIN